MDKGLMSAIMDKLGSKGKTEEKGEAPETDEDPANVALESAVKGFFKAGSAGDYAKAGKSLRAAMDLCSTHKAKDEDE